MTCLFDFFYTKITIKAFGLLIIPPANLQNVVTGVYSDPYVRPFVRSSVRSSVSPNL